MVNYANSATPVGVGAGP